MKYTIEATSRWTGLRQAFLVEADNEHQAVIKVKTIATDIRHIRAL